MQRLVCMMVRDQGQDRPNVYIEQQKKRKSGEKKWHDTSGAGSGGTNADDGRKIKKDGSGHSSITRRKH